MARVLTRIHKERPHYHTRHTRRFLRCKDGITSLEFAFIVPVFIVLVMGIIEFSMIMFTFAVMESATYSTARLGKTGYTDPELSREAFILQTITERTTGFLDPELLSITATVYANFDDVGAPEPYIDGNGNDVYDLGESYSDINGNGQWDSDMGSAGYGDANDIVVYTITYPWTIMTPVVSTIIGGVYDVTVRTVVKNEPYDIQ